MIDVSDSINVTRREELRQTGSLRVQAFQKPQLYQKEIKFIKRFTTYLLMWPHYVNVFTFGENLLDFIVWIDMLLL